MNKISKHQALILKDTRGANLVEYIILVGVIAIIALAGFRVFGSSVNDKINSQAGTIKDI